MKAGTIVRVLLGICLLVLPVPLFSWEGAFYDFLDVSYSARMSALGGLHTALADDESTLFSNPAGFFSAEPGFFAPLLTVNLYESASQISGELLSGSGSSANPPRRAAADLIGPIAAGYIGNGWGFGLVSSSNVGFYVRGAPSPSAWEYIQGTIMLVAGRSFRVPLPDAWSSTLDFGLSVVLFAAGKTMSLTDIRQFLLGSVDAATVLANSVFFQRALGVGAEFGLLYSFKDILSFGIAGRNLSFEQFRTFGSFWDFFGGAASSPTYNVLPLDLSAGILFRPPLGWLGSYISDLTLLADYHNIFDFLIYPAGATNPLLHIGLGAEVRLLRIVSLRAGFYQLLPSFGVGLDLSVLDLSLAYFGRELSSEPGGYTIYGLSFGLKIKY